MKLALAILVILTIAAVGKAAVVDSAADVDTTTVDEETVEALLNMANLQNKLMTTVKQTDACPVEPTVAIQTIASCTCSFMRKTLAAMPRGRGRRALRENLVVCFAGTAGFRPKLACRSLGIDPDMSVSMGRARLQAVLLGCLPILGALTG